MARRELVFHHITVTLTPEEARERDRRLLALVKRVFERLDREREEARTLAQQRAAVTMDVGQAETESAPP